MLHDNVFLLASLLDGKMLNVDVPSRGSRAFLIDHMESCHVVNEQTCQARLKSIKCCENIAKILGNLPTSHRQMELCFSQIGGNHSFNATFPRNSSKAEEHNKSSYGVTGLDLVAWAASRQPINSSWKMRGNEGRLGSSSGNGKGHSTSLQY